MLGRRAFVLLTIFNFVYQRSTEQIIFTNGWIPMTHNDIYNQIKRTTHNYVKSTEYPVYRTTKPPINEYTNLVPRQINSKNDFRDVEGSLRFLNKKPVYTTTDAKTAEDKNEEAVNSMEITRKGKKAWINDLDTNDDNIVAIHEIDSTKENIDYASKINEETAIYDIIKAAAASKSYEVTENSDKSTATEDNYTTENVGYQYNPPTDGNQNLTSTFYKILSKYNINAEDKLPNYDLSLQRKVQNPSLSAYRDPLPFGYNNLNHLPVDPLLAVFLSNYGFYLPSLYGIKANYNNLYGYLASNNIHNNKPFGLYKVFSDSDSWN